MQMNRRFFLHKGALAIAGTTAIPSFIVRSVMAEAAAAAPNRRLVVIFQRGAADGLNIVVPYREKNYYSMRPSIAIPQNQVLDLDGFFGLHPSLASFKPLYDQAISPSSTPQVRPTPHAPISTRRTTWSLAPPASRARRMDGSTALSKPKTCAIAAQAPASSTPPSALSRSQ